MGRPRWIRTATLTLSSLVAVYCAIILVAFAFERLSFEPTASNLYWAWVLSGLARWAAAAIVVSLAAIVLVAAGRRDAISLVICALAVLIAVIGVVANRDRLSPSGAEIMKVQAFASSAGTHPFRTSNYAANGFPVGVVEWTSNESPLQLCKRLGTALSGWADAGSVTHPVGGGPQASSPGIPCRWIATSGGWPVSGQVSVLNSQTSVRVEIAPPGTQ